MGAPAREAIAPYHRAMSSSERERAAVVEGDDDEAAIGVVAPASFAARTFESFGNPQFRWYLFAMLGHFSAQQMQQMARGVLVFQLTDSFAALGTVGLANAAPRILLALVGGVIADRSAKRRVVQAGQLASMALSLTLAVLLVGDLLRWEHLLIAAAVQGGVNALTQPARQSMIPEIVGMRRLTNAIALNVAGRNTTRLIAPAIGGLLFAAFGAAFVYFVMTALYLFSVVTLSRVAARPSTPPSRPASDRRARGRGGISELSAGFRYIVAEPTIRMLLATHVVIILFSMPYQRMLPGFVSDVFGGGPEQFGMLLSVAGVGSLVGSVLIASAPARRRGRLLLLGSLAMGVLLLAFSASSTLWVTAMLMALIGGTQAIRQSMSNVLVHTYVDDAFRGRVASVLSMEVGLVSLGSFGVGLAAATFGVQYALAATSLGLIAFVAAVIVLVPRYRALD